MCRLKTCTHFKTHTHFGQKVAAGFQPAVSPGRGWGMCRLKTCTHFKTHTHFGQKVAAGF
jgi:hypothetical protein